MSRPDHLLSLMEFDRLPEDGSRRYELQEGVLQETPKAAPLHQRAAHALVGRLNSQLPESWEAAADVEVALDAEWPATVRVPDAVITTPEAMERGESRLRATDLAVAVEVESPGSRRVDRLVKMQEYALARIPQYWLVNIDDPVTITAHSLLAAGMYQAYFSDGGVFKATVPCELTVDLSGLVRSPTAR